MTMAMTFSPAANAFTKGRPKEDDRMERYHTRDPPTHALHDTAGWKYLSSRRFEQAEHRDVNDGRGTYDLWLPSVTGALVMPDIAATGWRPTRAPQELADTLRREIRGAVVAGDYRWERSDELILGGDSSVQGGGVAFTR